MATPQSSLLSSHPAARPVRRSLRTTHEGVRAGLVGATAVWLWLFIDDRLSHATLRTPVLLGRALLSIDRFGPATPAWEAVLAFTVAHYALWIGVGSLAGLVVRRAVRMRSLLLGTTSILILVQFVFTVFSAGLAQGPLGTLAWRDIALGNLVGWIATWWYLAHRHQELRHEWAHAAEEEES